VKALPLWSRPGFVVAVAVADGFAAKFAAPDDEGAVEEIALL